MFKLGDKVKIVYGYGVNNIGRICGIETNQTTKDVFYYVELATTMVIRTNERQLVCCFQ